jgi:hypothetical protein
MGLGHIVQQRAFSWQGCMGSNGVGVECIYANPRPLGFIHVAPECLVLTILLYFGVDFMSPYILVVN